MRLPVIDNARNPCKGDGGTSCKSDGGSACKGESTRRGFLVQAAMAMAGGLLAGCTSEQREDFFKKHFNELTQQELALRLSHMRAELKAKFGKDVDLKATEAIDGVLFGAALDISRCTGCRECVYACVKENNQSRDPQIQWIRVLEMDKSKGIDLETANPYYEYSEVPAPDKFYFPVSCQMCQNPPCVRACPVGATWTEKDGITVIDSDWCIGCRCCMSACPYGARHFNWAEPNLPAQELNPIEHILGNRPRPSGRRREVHLLHPARPTRALPRLCRSLSGGGSQVRQPARPGERGLADHQDQAGVHSQERAQDRTEVLLLLRRVLVMSCGRGLPCAEL